MKKYFPMPYPFITGPQLFAKILILIDAPAYRTAIERREELFPGSVQRTEEYKGSAAVSVRPHVTHQ